MTDIIMPTVTVLRSIDVSRYPWCNSAVMFRVEHGKGALKHICEDAECPESPLSQLTLNDVPILQAYYPWCSTCSGLLATGYGTENINCTELDEVRDAINSDYVDINTSAEILKPLFGLLEDGFYILADVPHYPTYGGDKFFYDIPNKMTDIRAACTSLYNHDLLTITEGFPKYLYPTQSDTCLNEERVEHYVKMFKSDPNLARAIARHEYGFVSALLDGHHKATAAARLGIPINCLTIIKNDSFTTWKDMYGNEVKQAWFSSISFSPDEIDGYFFSTGEPCTDVSLKEYELIKGTLSVPIKADTYPTVKELTDIYAADLENADITDETLDKWMSSIDGDDLIKLRYMLVHFIYNDRLRAFRLAKKIIAADSDKLPIKEAYRALLHDRSEQTEKLFVDYLAEHSSDDDCWEIVNSYWSK